MKLLLAVFMFSTSVCYAQQAFVAETVTCDNGSVVNPQAVASEVKDDVTYSLEIVSQEKDGMILSKKQTSSEGVVIEQKYSLTQHGVQGDNWSFFAFSVESAEYFYVLVSFDGLKLVSIYSADRDFKACGGGMIVTSLASLDSGV